jgi:hypothetical protein
MAETKQKNNAEKQANLIIILFGRQFIWMPVKTDEDMRQ